MDKKTIIGTCVGALLVILVSVVWNIFTKGAESVVAKNPKIVELEAKIASLEAELESTQDVMDQDRLKNAQVHVKAATQIEEARENLRNVITLLRGDS